MIVYLWMFEIDPVFEKEFVRIYGPRGEWAQLFGRSSGYVNTELFHDVAIPSRYLTVDRWTSPGEFEAFRASREDDFEELDRRGGALTRMETFLGKFESERVTLFLGRER